MFTINVPLPGLDDATVKELVKLLQGLEKAAGQGPVRGGVMSEGDAAAYALVWEWGNARQTQKGPKTVLGVNPDGEEVWLSIQAPHGYIRINEPEYMKIIQDELAHLDFEEMQNGEAIREEMKVASASAAYKIAELIREFAPVDTGALKDSIQPCDPDDPDLKVDDEEMELGEGLEHALLKKTRMK